MLKRLQQKWNVSGWSFILILCTFAVTGTFTAWVSKEITNWFDAEKFSFLWWFLKILILLVGYQLFILFFGFCFGQFQFFWNFEKKLLTRLGIMKKESNNRIAIFASGKGSNAERIIQFFKNDQTISVDLIVCNKPGAGVLQIAAQEGIETILITKDAFLNGSLLTDLQQRNIDLIVLAGFLWKLPENLVRAYPNRIINIHPALLPKFGGKGMYGSYVHEAVLANHEEESGITIHYVDEVYDNGDIILQKRFTINENDTPETLASRIHELEHAHYAPTIKAILQKQNQR